MENTSCQGPEHAHIDIIKSVAHLTNNKDVFLCILRYHCHSGLLQQYEQMLEDMVGQGEARAIQLDRIRMEQALTGDRNFSISCELGVLYPSLRAMMNNVEWMWLYCLDSEGVNVDSARVRHDAAEFD
jgi:hypothetical protein